MKKVLISILTVILIASIYGCGHSNNSESYPDISNFTNASKNELKPYLEEVRSSVESYYKASTSNEQDFPTLPISLSKSCKKYLELKFKYESSNNMKENGKKYIKGEYKIDDYKIVNNRIVCVVSANVLFQYLDAQSTSRFADEIQIAIENPQSPQIVDWYNGDPASFDSITRDHNLDLTNDSNLLVNQDIEQILDKGTQLLE